MAFSWSITLEVTSILRRSDSVCVSSRCCVLNSLHGNDTLRDAPPFSCAARCARRRPPLTLVRGRHSYPHERAVHLLCSLEASMDRKATSYAMNGTSAWMPLKARNPCEFPCCGGWRGGEDTLGFALFARPVSNCP